MPPIHNRRRKGVTLIELSVVVTMILSLISGLFFSAGYYRDSANQASCIVQIEAMQKAVRSYQNFNSLNPGDPIVESELVGPDKAIPANQRCPHSNGTYILMNEIPAIGVPFATCEDFDSTSGVRDQAQAHNAVNTAGW